MSVESSTNKPQHTSPLRQRDILHRVTTTKLKQPSRVGRYTHEAVAREISRAIGRGPRGTHARLAKALGLSSQGLSHRLTPVYARFDVVQLGICADFFSREQGVEGYGRGWPLMSYEESLSHWNRNHAGRLSSQKG